MSDNLDAAEAALREKFADDDFAGSVKFDIDGEGVLMLVDGAVSKGDDDSEADVTIAGDLDTFKEMFDGDLSPTAAYMTGKIRIDGDMATAMKLSAKL